MFAQWKEAKAALDATIAARPDRGAQPDAELERASDYYNRLNEQSAALQHRLAELERLEAEKIRFTDEQSIASEFDERAFWFRRFHTSLAIAHGGAFAAIASHLFDKDISSEVAAAAWHPMAFFASGMAIAGVLPIALHRRNERVAWWLAGGSALLFLCGLTAALYAVWRKAGLYLPV